MRLPEPIRFDADVLVLGTGGAGLRAALEARRAGAEVLVVSKMTAAAPNCTAVAWGGVTYAPPDQAGELFRQVVATGGFLNDQRLVARFAADVSERVAELADLGVKMEVLDAADTRGALGVTRVAPGARPRGFGMVRPLRQAAEALGVRFVDELMIASLLVSGGRVTGALGVWLRDNQPVAIAAQAVVIASGGGACLYARTDNPAGTTGDGIALAYEAGAELVDMELVSFQFPAERIEEAFAAPAVPCEALLKTGTAHYYLGGVRIDENCGTSVAGLYAAGEVTGGLFGAGRLGGAAVADTLVFGALAGHGAARYAAQAGAAEPATDALQAALGKLAALASKGGAPAGEVTARLREVMWRGAGVIKSRESLESALAGLGQLEALTVTAPGDLRAGLECLNLRTLARPILLGALLRAETRGCFWRHDFPEPDNANWLRNILWRQVEGESEYEVRPAVMMRLTEPTEPRLGAGCFPYLPAEDRGH